MRRAVLFSALCLFLCTSAHAATDPVISGYVTRVAAPDDFDIEGYRVVLAPDTYIRTGTPKQLHPNPSIAPFLGQRGDLWGHVDDKTHSIRTTRLDLLDPGPAKLSGSAIIDFVPAPQPGNPYRMRADGRMLELPDNVLQHAFVHTPTTQTPATPQSLRTNVWIEYTGERLADGRIVLSGASFTENALSPEEDAALRKTEYDPSAVDPTAFQSDANRLIHGIDPKLIPPYRDKPVQDRIDRIGNSLIPAYQRALQPDDPTRIHFRFQLVNEPKWYGAYALPSGIILVPWHIAHRLTDDSELAAVLGASVASILEKGPYLALGRTGDLSAARNASSAALIAMPLIGIPAKLTTGLLQKNLSDAEHQSDRVALTLMNDAGYDVTKAPEAWWTFAVKEGKDPHRLAPWDRPRALFAELGTTWQPAHRQSIEVKAVEEPRHQ